MCYEKMAGLDMEGAENNETAANTKGHKPKEEFLSLFWTLSEQKDGSRLQATSKMVQLLAAKQKNKRALCKDLEYALGRLLKGLASDRKCSRLGFATALTQVLREFDVVTAEVVLNVLEKANKELKAAGYDGKSEKKNAEVGKLMAYLALIQSGKLDQAHSKHVNQVVDGLMKIRQKRKELLQLDTAALCQLIAKVPENVFRDHVWGHLEPELSGGWKSCTPDTLQVLLEVNDRYQDCVGKAFLSAHWNTKNIMNTKNHKYLKAVISESVATLPLIHNIGPVLVRRAIKKKETFTDFWSAVVSDGLASDKLTHRFLAFHFVSVALPLATSEEEVTTILSESVVNAIVNSRKSHFDEKPLHNAAGNVINDITRFTVNNPCGDIQMAVVLAMLNSQESITFDPSTRTKAIGQMVEKFRPEAMEKWANLMMEMIRGSEDLPIKEKPSVDDEARRTWAVFELTRILVCESKGDDKDWQLNILKFLLLHGFCTIEDPAHVLEGSKPLLKVVGEKTLSALQTAFFKSLNRLGTYRHPNSKISHKDKRPYIDLVYQVVQYAQELLSTEGIEMRQNLLPEVKEHWEKMLATVENLRKKHDKEGRIDEGHAFELLFLYLGLQLFSCPQIAIESLEDLHVCCNKAFKKRRRMSMKQSGEEPDWMEVVTDVSLSLLSQQSHLVRVIVKSVFAMLAPNMTKGALDLILNVFKPKSEEDDPLAFEDDDDDIEEEEDDGETEKTETEEKQEGESEDESSDEEEDEEEEEEVDETLRHSLKEALGQAAIPSEDEPEDDSDSDLDDEAMFKLDDAISAAFRNMMKTKKNSKYVKEQKQQLKGYRMKCLDLLNVYVESDPIPSLALEMISPLLALMNQGVRDKLYHEEGLRATKILHTLIANRKVVPDPMVDRDALPERIQELVTLSTKVTGAPMVKEVALSCIFLIRLLLSLDNSGEPSPLKTRAGALLREVVKKNKVLGNQQEVLDIIKDNLTDFCLKRDSHLSHIFFHTLLERQASMLWALTDHLLDLAMNTEVRLFCRTQVWCMLASMVTKFTAQNVGEKSWTAFMDRLVTIITQTFDQLDVKNMKPKMIQEVLEIVIRILAISPNLKPQILTEDLTTKVRDIKMHQASLDLKRTCNRVLNIAQKGQAAKKRATEDRPEEFAAAKKTKLDTEPSLSNGHGKTPKSAKKKQLESKMEVESTEDQPSETPPKSSKKKKKKKNDNLSDSLDVLPPKLNLCAVLEEAETAAFNEHEKTPKSAKKNKLEITMEAECTEEKKPSETTPKSNKKKHKKNIDNLASPKLDVSAVIEEADITQFNGHGKTPKSAKKNKLEITMEAECTEEEKPSETTPKSNKKKHKKNIDNLTSPKLDVSAVVQEADVAQFNGHGKTPESAKKKKLEITMEAECTKEKAPSETTPKSNKKKHKNVEHLTGSSDTVTSPKLNIFAVVGEAEPAQFNGHGKTPESAKKKRMEIRLEVESTEEDKPSETPPKSNKKKHKNVEHLTGSSDTVTSPKLNVFAVVGEAEPAQFNGHGKTPESAKKKRMEIRLEVESTEEHSQMPSKSSKKKMKSQRSEDLADTSFTGLKTPKILQTPGESEVQTPTQVESVRKSARIQRLSGIGLLPTAGSGTPKTRTPKTGTPKRVTARMASMDSAGVGKGLEDTFALDQTVNRRRSMRIREVNN